MGGERGRVGNETGERKEGEGKGRKGRSREGTPPGSCLHPSDMKSWIKTLGMARILRGGEFFTEGNIGLWDTVVGGCCRKHKCHGDIF